MRGRPVALGPGAAAAAWASVLVVLNLVGDPLVAVATFAGLALLAVRTGHRRLLLVSVLVGAGLLVVVPGVSFADGSFDLVYRSYGWRVPHDIDDVLAISGAVLRVPAQVLATVLLALVPARLLVAATSRFSPRAALLGGLAARLRPLLARDVALVRDELASRGMRIGRGAPLPERARGVVALWEAVVSGMLDRAFQTAAALETRGYGVARPTAAAMRDPHLADHVVLAPARDRAMVACAAFSIAWATWLRAAGIAQPPALHVLGGDAVEIGAWSLVAAAFGFVVGSLPAWWPAGDAVTRPDPGPASRRTEGDESSRLQLVDVAMRYPAAARPSISGVTLRVEPGELVVLTGPSGSGKSTLLDVATGIAPRSTGGHRSGVVRLGDHVLGLERRLGEARIAAVFQDPESQVLVGQVAEEVAFGLRHAGLPIADVEAAVRAMLERLGILHLARRDCSTLSGGELQRVLLAAALVLRPALLVLDEPASQVDVASERRFWDAVDEVRRERSLGVLAVEHRLDHLLLRADRIVELVDGRIVAERLPGTWESMPSPYEGLVPNPVAAGMHPRLSLQVSRLEAAPGRPEARSLLRGFALELPPRSIVTLEGPNGTGKSTLLRAIRGLHPAPIDVRIDGVPRGDVGSSAARVAFLSQGAGALLPGRTVRHAIEATATLLAQDPSRAHVALAAAGLAGRTDAHPSELSVGERQRLALVAATSHGAPVWLLDEPTRGMDAEARRWVACHVLAHAAAGGVVLVATHDASLAAAVATHRLRLDARTGPRLVQVARGLDGRVLEPDAGSLPDGTEVEA